jgi:hypothetical protein
MNCVISWRSVKCRERDQGKDYIVVKRKNPKLSISGSVFIREVETKAKTIVVRRRSPKLSISGSLTHQTKSIH